MRKIPSAFSEVASPSSGSVLAKHIREGAAASTGAGKGLRALLGKEKFINPEQIDRAIIAVKSMSEREGAMAILIGGVAMQVYGSPRLTKDVDFAVDRPLPQPENFRFLGPIDFGGGAYIAPDGAKIDIVVRNDEYKALYDEAIQAAILSEEGILIVSPEYLAAMEFAAHTEKHTLDLKWLLKQKGLVGRRLVSNLIYRHVGQKFGVESFDRVLDEVELELRRRSGPSDPTDYP